MTTANENEKTDNGSDASDCSMADVNYVELNMSNYCEEDVSDLNAWAVEAFAAIEEITGEAAFGGLPETKQDRLLNLIGGASSDAVYFVAPEAIRAENLLDEIGLDATDYDGDGC